MELIDFVIIGIIALIIGGAVAYIIKQKRNGVKCIGCPYAKSCGAKACDSGSSPCACSLPKKSENNSSSPNDA